MSQTSNVKSTQLINRDASPQLINDPGNSGGFVRNLMATIECVTADLTSSTYRFFTLPSNAVIVSLKMWADALSASTTLDIGVYATTIGGALSTIGGAAGTTDEKALFASAVAATSANTGTDYRFSALDINTAGKQLWDLMSLTADTSTDYDIVVTPHVAVVAGGTISMHIAYSV